MSCRLMLSIGTRNLFTISRRGTATIPGSDWYLFHGTCRFRPLPHPSLKTFQHLHRVEISMADTFTVTGTIDIGRETQQFSRDVEAESASHAEDVAYAQLTSEHGVSRANVRIDEVQ
ncbi:MAG: 50S ribosomal protein L18Ae [Candidatus Nanohaloarchaea archaeon]|nr:50S ribosomal protein L18Ae [Candidatus Nanohaloarchaea archaeon]